MGKASRPAIRNAKIQPDAALPDGILPEQAVFQQGRADVVDAAWTGRQCVSEPCR